MYRKCQFLYMLLPNCIKTSDLLLDHNRNQATRRQVQNNAQTWLPGVPIWETPKNDQWERRICVLRLLETSVSRVLRLDISLRQTPLACSPGYRVLADR